MTDILILGATGLAGNALVARMKEVNFTYRCVARHCEDISADVSNRTELEKLIQTLKPKVVINCVGEIDLNLCESDFDATWDINVAPVIFLSDLANKYNFKLVQISTDHYYIGASKEAHDETFPVTLLNNYSRQKYVAELFASRSKNALIIRTAFTGISSYRKRCKKTLWTWICQVDSTSAPVNLFGDAYTSLLDVETFARVTIDLIALKATGIFNVSSSEVFSKAEFFQVAMQKMGRLALDTKKVSVQSLTVPRANNLGLCPKKTEKLVNYRMPSLSQVILNLMKNMEDQ